MGGASKEEEERRKRLKPAVKPEDAKALAARFGVTPVAAAPLESYDDQNYKITTAEGEFYTLKIRNGVESEKKELLAAQAALMQRLHDKGIVCPLPRSAPGGASVLYEVLDTAGGGKHTLAVRLLSWVQGVTMSSSPAPPSANVMESSGAFLGRFARAVAGFDPEGLHWSHVWDMAEAAQVEHFVGAILGEERQRLVREVLAAFVREVLPEAGLFRKAVVMGDFNDANIILNEETGQVAGVIDFGDSIYTWLVNDVAIAMAYSMLGSFARETQDPLGAAALVLRGFQSEFPLLPAESKHLRVLVACRLAVSVTMGAYSRQNDPANQYLNLHAAPAWSALEMLWQKVHPVHTKALWEKAAMLVEPRVLLRGSQGTDVYAHASEREASSAAAKGVVNAVTNGTNSPAKRAKVLPTVTFVTGNANKLAEVAAILGPNTSIHLASEKIDLPELQGDTAEVSLEKCRLAAEHVRGAVIVEDTALCFNALHGLPGPYIKHFLERLGHTGLNNMLAAYDDKTAYAQCVFGYCGGPGQAVQLFEGRCPGTIVAARGPPNSFGWDPVFQPEGGDKTFAEMAKSDKNAISHRSRALAKLRDFFEAGGAAHSSR